VTTWARYGSAVLAMALATGAGAMLSAWVPVDRLPFVLFLPGVLAVTVLAGQGPGVLATVIGPLMSELVIVHDHTSLVVLGPELVGLAFYVVVGIGVALLAGHLRHARARAEAESSAATRRSEELAQARQAVDRLARDAQRRARDFSTLFEELPIGLAIAEDVDCRSITPNRALAEMLGVPAGQNISQTADRSERMPMRITSPDGTVMSAEELSLQRAARTGRSVRGIDVDVYRADGSRISLLEYAAPLLDDDGRPRGAIGAFLDVSSRRRTAEEQRFLAEATRLLNASLDYQATLGKLGRLAVPQMADYAVLDIVSPQGEVVRAGLAHRDPEREVQLRQALVLTPANQGVRGNRGMLNLVKAGRSVLWADVNRQQLEGMGLRRDQIEFVLSVDIGSCVIVPMLLRGRVVGAFAWMRHTGREGFDDRDLALAEEIARRAAAAVENARLYREAQTANRLKDEFVATLSHELRTPLNALLGWTELLRSGQLTPDRQRHAIDAIERTARLQSQITNDLVDVSQAASGAFRMAPRYVDGGEIIGAAAGAFRLAAEAKGVRLDVQIADGMPPVYVDPDRLQQIVFNLVANAVKFTPEGTVAVLARVVDNRLEVEVRDTGIGIAPGFLPFVFDRFRQADGSTSRQYGGLGLGLAIVRSLVELHGGQVLANSEGEGHGATFSVWLPAIAPASAVRHATADAASE
jgi:signal transduction histidine kinase/PAS domain-containing protein